MYFLLCVKSCHKGCLPLQCKQKIGIMSLWDWLVAAWLVDKLSGDSKTESHSVYDNSYSDYDYEDSDEDDFCDDFSDYDNDDSDNLW